MNSNDNIERNNIFNLETHDRDRENASLSPVSESERNHRINNETTNVDTSSSSENTEAEVDVESGVNNYSNYYYNNHNPRNNHRRRCRECNYLNTPLYRSRNIEIDRDRDRNRYLYLQYEREQYRDRTMLNQIYNELLHQNNLLQSMRIDISNIWNRIRTNDEYSRSRYQNNRNNTTNNSSNNRQNGSTSNTRININGIPYVLENIQHFNTFPRRPPNTATSANFIESLMNIMDFQSNVPIIPTREQILNATREIQFGEIENPINITCPISLESFQETDTITQILYCGHNFNTRQLNTWFHSNVRCPMCRYDIREYNNDLGVPLETPTTPTPTPTTPTSTPTMEPLDISNNPVNNNSERRTRHSQTSSFESSINNIASNLSTIAIDTINELFERNTDNFEENGDSRFLFDPSNNILLFETIINNGNRFRYRNNATNSNNQNRDPRNIV